MEEENIADTLLTIAVDEKERICGVQKRGEKGISRSILDKAVDVAVEKSKWLISQMKNALNNPGEYTKPLSEMGA
jgi:exosome complex component RRP42